MWEAKRTAMHSTELTDAMTADEDVWNMSEMNSSAEWIVGDVERVANPSLSKTTVVMVAGTLMRQIVVLSCLRCEATVSTFCSVQLWGFAVVRRGYLYSMSPASVLDVR